MSAPARRIALCGLVAAAVVASVIPAPAQTIAPPDRRLQVGVGLGWSGGASLGERPADLRGGSGSPFRLFNSESELAPAGSMEARVGLALTGRYALEARAAISRPNLRTSISSDAESPQAITLVERVDQYVFEGGVVARVHEWRFLNWTPFAIAGAGYVRELHEGQTLVEEGRLFYVGGGVARWLVTRGQGFLRAAGLRADARLNFTSGDGSLDDGGRRQGAMSGSVVVAF